MQKLFEDYASAGEKMDALEALQLLTRAYIKECGYSLGMRTAIYLAAEIWQCERLPKQGNNPFTDEQIKLPLVTLMPLICEEYIPEKHNKWDVGCGISDDELRDMCLTAIEKQLYDKPTLCALSWGIKVRPNVVERWMEEDIRQSLMMSASNS